MMINIFIRSVLLLVLFAAMWSAYIASWAGKIIPSVPLGAVFRDILLLIFYISSLFVLFKRRVDRNLVILNFFYIFLLFVCLGLVFYAPSILAGVNGMRSYTLFPSVFLSLLNFRKIIKERDAKYVLWFVVINAILVSFLAIAGVLIGPQVFEVFGYSTDFAGGDFKAIDSYEELFRANGGVADALNFGYLMSAIYVFLLNAVFGGYKKYWYVLLPVMLIIVASAFMSLTRGAMVIISLSTLIYIFKRKSIKLFSLTFLLVVAALLYMPSEFYDTLAGRLTDSSSTSAGSTQERFQMAEKSINFLAVNPMGVGMGTQGSANRFNTVDQRINTDNYFFWVFLELGIYVGMLFFSFLVFEVLVARKYLFEKDFLYVMLLGLFLSSLVSSAPTSAIYCIYFWTLLYFGSEFKY